MLSIGAVGVIGATAVAVGALRGGSTAGASSVSVRGPAAASVGDRAPAFSAPTTSGARYTLAAGRPALLYFMAGWCGSCVREAKSIDAVAPSYKKSADLVAVDIDPSDPWSSLRRFAQDIDASGDDGGSPGYVFAKDDGSIGRAFSVSSLDVTVGIDASGRVAYRHTGGLDEAGVRAALAQMGVSA